MFRGNSCYDPDYTGVGIQPYGWDQQTGPAGNGLFNRYRVYASSITVYFHDTAGFPVKFVLVPSPTPTPVANGSDDIARMPYAKQNLIRTSTDTTNMLKTKHYCSSKMLFPLPKNPENLSCDYNDNPAATAQWFWYLCFDSYTTQSSQGGTCTILYDVKITYYTKLYRNQNVQEST